MPTARKVLFYFFVLLYCVLCPLLILYSFGYVLHPANRQISQTGLIHIETIPAGADIYLGKSRYALRTPASVANLSPGRYEVTLKLKGRRLWRHEVSIEQGRAAVFSDVLLLPQHLDPAMLEPGSVYQDLIVLPETDGFILKKSPQLQDVFIFDRKKERVRPLAEEGILFADFPVAGIYQQREGKGIIIFGGSLWNKKFYLFDREKGSGAIDITKLFHSRPDAIIWSAAYPDDCFARYGDYLDRLDLGAMSVSPRFLEGLKGFGTRDKWLYILEEDNRISKITPEGTGRSVLFEGGHLGKGLFSKSRFYTIQFLDDDTFVFLGEGGDLITTVPPYTLAESGAAGIDFHKRGKRLLFWSKNTIWVADFTQGRPENALFSDSIVVRAVFERGKNITQCFWAYNGTHIIFKDRGQVFLLELIPDGKNHCELLAEAKHNSAVFYSDEAGSLYYLDAKGNTAKLKIIPEEARQAVTFVGDGRAGEGSAQ